ncbi:MAG: formate dehydrogenase accessory sulfurtransferase FdhD [Parvularculaceae bacterium]|nr:formate dehydrogenase accessory sulfurtransferase FdhD [Parvularculaceae bacterium]
MAIIRSFGVPPPATCGAYFDHGAWQVPEETPVAFVYNQRNYAVMLATPLDIEDFAIGFSLTESVVDHIDEISSVDVHYTNRGVDLRIGIDAGRLDRLDLRQRRRNLAGRAGCGVCGLESAESFFEKLPTVEIGDEDIDPAAISIAFDQLAAHQPLNAQTYTVHAAAFAAHTGEILLTREDVGRHNALDKLIGAMVRADVNPRAGFLLMSSRCSYEIIEKAARANIATVASISAPTAFAVRKAAEANIRLYPRDGDRFVLLNP